MTGNRLWAIGVIVGIVVIVVLGWVIGISPALTQASEAATQTQIVSSQNSVIRATTAKLQAEFATLPAIDAKLKALQAEFPDSADLGGLLRQLQDLAQSTGVTISTFTAGEAAPYGGAAAVAAAAASKSAASPGASSSPSPSPTPSAGASAATAAPVGKQPSASLVQGLFTIPVVIGVTGSTQQIMEFTNASQLNDRFFLATDVTLVKGTLSGAASGTLTGAVFVVRNATPVAAATPAG
jgi:Tfp pilus assembly protein PilO